MPDRCDCDQCKIRRVVLGDKEMPENFDEARHAIETVGAVLGRLLIHADDLAVAIVLQRVANIRAEIQGKMKVVPADVSLAEMEAVGHG